MKKNYNILEAYMSIGTIFGILLIYIPIMSFQINISTSIQKCGLVIFALFLNLMLTVVA